MKPSNQVNSIPKRKLPRFWIWRGAHRPVPENPHKEDLSRRIRYLWLDCNALPPSLNDRLHWMSRAKASSEFRLAARDGWRFYYGDSPPWKRTRLSAIIYRSVLGRADEDNDRSRLKPIIDGLVDAGLVPDDRREYVELGKVSEAKRKWPGIMMLAEELC